MIDYSYLGRLNSSVSDAGVIEKWYDKKNGLYIKTSRYLKESKQYGTEAIMECIAYDVGLLLGVDVVPYWLDMITKKNGETVLVCVSKDYRVIVGAKSRLSARRFLSKLGYLKTIDKSSRYRNLIAKFPYLRTDLDKMIVFDYLVANTDRHLNNFEFYTTGNNTVKLAPLFDNGSSLLSDWYDESELYCLREDEDLFNENIRFAETPSKCFSNEHITELRLVDKSVFNQLNMQIQSSQIDSIVSKYKDFLTPLRLELITILLKLRYTNIISFASRN